MLIVCPNCATSYDVDVASLRPNGRKVRCVRCRTVWQAELSHAARLMAAAEALAPVRHAVGRWRKPWLRTRRRIHKPGIRAKLRTRLRTRFMAQPRRGSTARP